MAKNIINWLNLRLLIVFLLAIGIFFRFYHLDNKVYWHDEVYTSIRTAGYSGQKIIDNTFNGTIIKPQEILKYQKVSPTKTWQDSLDRLIEHPEHPPLYYLLSRLWQLLFGSSIAATRSLSAVFSLLLFPLLYWLCWELFNSKTVGWYAIAIVAVSPVQVLYAQEAREYSLLLVTTALSYISLIGAVKRNNFRWWLFYAVSLASNFYVSLIGGYVAIAQLVYIIILEKFRLTKITINFILSGIFSLLLFAPWLGVIYTNWSILQAKTNWTKVSFPFVELLRYWELHLSSIFIDLHPTVNGYIAVRVAGFLFIFLCICYRFVCLKAKPQIWLLLGTMIIVPAAILIVPDVINGGIKSIMTRYFLPSILGIQIVVAYWLSNISKAQNWQNLTRSIIMGSIILFGIISCTISAQSTTWWNKVVGYHNFKIAAIINRYPQPLLIVNPEGGNGKYGIKVGDVISLNHLLDNNVSLLLSENQNIPPVDFKPYSDVLFWNIQEESRIKFQNAHNSELEMIEEDYYPPLWRMKTPATKQKH